MTPARKTSSDENSGSQDRRRLAKFFDSSPHEKPRKRQDNQDTTLELGTVGAQQLGQHPGASSSEPREESVPEALKELIEEADLEEKEDLSPKEEMADSEEDATFEDARDEEEDEDEYEDEEIEEDEEDEEEDEDEEDLRDFGPVGKKIEEFTQSESGLIGLVLTAIGILGLVLVVAFLPWISTEGGSDDDFKYGDFGRDIEDMYGRDFDMYYGRIASWAVYSLGFILLCGLALLVHSRTNLLVNLLNASLANGPEEIGNEDDQRYALRLMAATLLTIPAVMITVAGARFMGFVTLSSRSHFSGQGSSEGTLGSAAGLVLLIIGSLLLMGIIFYIYERLPGLMDLLKSKKKRLYLQRCQNFSALVFLLSVVALVTLSMLPSFEITVERDQGGGTYTDEVYISDGFTGVSDYDEREDLNKIHDDFQFLKLLLHSMVFLSIMCFLGTLFFPFSFDTHHHYFISAIGIVPIVATLILIVSLFLVSRHAGNLEEDLEDLSGVSGARVESSFNYPLTLVPLLLFLLSGIYFKDIYENSIMKTWTAIRERES